MPAAAPNTRLHSNDQPPAPSQVSEAAGLLLRDSFVDAARTIDPLLRQIQRDHHGLGSSSRHGSFMRIPSCSNADDSLAAAAGKESAFARSPAAAASPNGPGSGLVDLSDNDCAAIFVIAGFSHLFAMVDPKWARSIAVQLTDRYPLFAIGFVLRAEAEAASGDFPAAYNLLSKVERDIRVFEGGDRSLYTALAPPSAVPSGTATPARVPSPLAQDASSSSATSSPRVLGASHMTEDDTDPAPLGFMSATSASFIRAVWLHVASRRLSAAGGASSSNSGFRSLSTGKLHEEAADVDLVLRYASAARTQLQEQQGRWLRYRALIEFSRHVGATVHPCSKCGAVPTHASAPPTQWRCAVCVAKQQRGPSSGRSTPGAGRGGSSVATSSTGGGAPPQRRSSNGLGAQLGEPQQAPIGTPRSPAGSFAFYRQHYDGNSTTAAADAAANATGGSSLAPPQPVNPNGRNSSLGTTTLTGPPTPHAAGIAATSGSFNGSFSGSFSSNDFGAVSSGGGSSTFKAAGGSSGKVWAPDTGSSCQRCAKSVGRMTRHHCRSCGRLVCGPCSQKRREVPLLGFCEAVRVCANCADVLDSSASQRCSPLHSPGLGPRGSEETLPDLGDE